MKIWKITATCMLLFYSMLECALNKTPATAKPVVLQLPTPSVQAISSTQQEIASLKNQLKEVSNKNAELMNLIKTKKELKNRIKTTNIVLVEKREKNKPIFERYQKAFDTKEDEDNVELAKQIKTIHQEMKSNHTELDKLYKNIWGIKTKIKRIAPNRATLLKKLHDKQKLLKQLQLAAEITKLKQ